MKHTDIAPLKERLDAAPVIDLNQLEDLKSLDEHGESLAAELIAIFRQEADRRLPAMVEAFKAQDYVTLNRHAHTFKSTSHNVGARRLAEICFEVEILTSADEDEIVDKNSVEMLLNDLRTEYEKVTHVLGSIQ